MRIFPLSVSAHIEAAGGHQRHVGNDMRKAANGLLFRDFAGQIIIQNGAQEGIHFGVIFVGESRLSIYT